MVSLPVEVALLRNLLLTQDGFRRGIHVAVIVDADPACIAFESHRARGRIVIDQLDPVGIRGLHNVLRKSATSATMKFGSPNPTEW